MQIENHIEPNRLLIEFFNFFTEQRKFTNLSKGNKRKQILSFDSSLNRMQPNHSKSASSKQAHSKQPNTNKSNGTTQSISTSDSILNDNDGLQNNDQDQMDTQVLFLSFQTKFKNLSTCDVSLRSKENSRFGFGNIYSI